MTTRTHSLTGQEGNLHLAPLPNKRRHITHREIFDRLKQPVATDDLGYPIAQGYYVTEEKADGTVEIWEVTSIDRTGLNSFNLTLTLRDQPLFWPWR